MAQNLMPAVASEILHTHPALSFSPNGYMYQINTSAHQAQYSIRNENQKSQKLSFPLLWAFGTGRVAQSYLFKKDDGKYYEARSSFFVSKNDLDFTPGRVLASPASIEEAMYRPVGEDEVQRCFSCHATAGSIGGRFDEKQIILGVTCESCHGPGAKHVAAEDHRGAAPASAVGGTIFNPEDLLPADAVDFCGACHSSWWDVKLSGGKGVSTTRSAPYRLVTSKCWGKGDARLTCTSCHDPHKQLQTVASAYDPVCRTCHLSRRGENPTASHPGKACPTATSNCTSCHMPKVYVPEMRADFTDHRIRIARPGEPFPE